MPIILQPVIMRGVDKLENGRYTLRTFCTGKKDQTYALYNLTQDQLAENVDAGRCLRKG